MEAAGSFVLALEKLPGVMRLMWVHLSVDFSWCRQHFAR
jgi:hypothetical protein